MAELFDQFDPASPCTTSFCTRISKAEYEKQASDLTQQAVADLIKYLDYNPTAYHNILRKRKREDEENAGMLSWLKVKMFTAMFGDEYCEKLDDKEAKGKLAALKNEMIKAYDYSEEAKGSGRRFSKRIACRNKQHEDAIVAESFKSPTSHHEITPVVGHNDPVKNLEFDFAVPSPPCSSTSGRKALSPLKISNNTINSLIPPPPPPPPVLPPPPTASTILHVPRHKENKTNVRKDLPTSNEVPQPQDGVLKSGSNCPITRNRIGKNKQVTNNKFEETNGLMESIKDPKLRAALKPVNIGLSDETPYQIRKKIKNALNKENDFPLFNQELISKFQNARSPQGSPFLSDVSSPDSFVVSP